MITIIDYTILEPTDQLENNDINQGKSKIPGIIIIQQLYTDNLVYKMGYTYTYTGYEI